MRNLIAILFIALGLPAFAQYKPNYYDTNSNPAISVAGSNAVVQLVLTNAALTNAYGQAATNIAVYQAGLVTNASGILAITSQQTNAAGILAITSQQTNAAGILAITSQQTNAAGILAITAQQTNTAALVANGFLNGVPTLNQVTAAGSSSSSGITVGGLSRFTNFVNAASNLLVGSYGVGGTPAFRALYKGDVLLKSAASDYLGEHMTNWVFLVKNAGYANAIGQYYFERIDAAGVAYNNKYPGVTTYILSNILTKQWEIYDSPGTLLYKTGLAITDPSATTWLAEAPAYDPAPDTASQELMVVKTVFQAGTNAYIGADKSFINNLYSDSANIKSIIFASILGTYYNSTFGGFNATAYYNNLNDPSGFTADLAGLALIRANDCYDMSLLNATVNSSIACLTLDNTSAAFQLVNPGTGDAAIDYSSLVVLHGSALTGGSLGASNGAVVLGVIPDGISKVYDNEFAYLSPHGEMFTVNSNGLASAAAGYSYSSSHYSDLVNFSIFTNKTLYCVNGTNQVIELIRAAENPWVIYRFVSTNGTGSFILTNSSLDNATIRNGIDHTIKNIGVGEVGLFSDGASWQLASKFRTVWPNAQFSCRTNHPISATPQAIEFSNVDFNNSQGIGLGVGTNATRLTSIWITNSGTYELDPSIIESFKTAASSTITFWFKSTSSAANLYTNILTIANSGTFATAQQNSVRVVTVPYIIDVSSITRIEIWVTGGASDQLEILAASGDRPLSPSVICPIKRISDSRP